MPQYAWECDACGDRREVIAAINEYDKVTLSGETCMKCGDGLYEVTFQGASFSFKGGAPTPRHYR